MFWDVAGIERGYFRTKGHFALLAKGHPPAPPVPFSAAPTLPYPAITLRRENAGFCRKPCCFFAKHCQKVEKMVNPGILRGYLGASPFRVSGRSTETPEAGP